MSLKLSAYLSIITIRLNRDTSPVGGAYEPVSIVLWREKKVLLKLGLTGFVTAASPSVTRRALQRLASSAIPSYL